MIFPQDQQSNVLDSKTPRLLGHFPLGPTYDSDFYSLHNLPFLLILLLILLIHAILYHAMPCCAIADWTLTMMTMMMILSP